MNSSLLNVLYGRWWIFFCIRDVHYDQKYIDLAQNNEIKSNKNTIKCILQHIYGHIYIYTGMLYFIYIVQGCYMAMRYRLPVAPSMNNITRQKTRLFLLFNGTKITDLFLLFNGNKITNKKNKFKVIVWHNLPIR